MKIVTYKIKIQYNLRIMKVIPTLSFITLIFLSAGCIRENRSGCGGYLSLKFRYTDSNGAPLTPGFPETDHLSVFVFDRQGIFVCERKDSALQLDHYMMEMPLPQGRYQFVVWAGLSESYRLSSHVPSQTHLEDFGLQLNRTTDNTVPILPSLLYHGLHETIDVNADEDQEITVDLRRITNNIHVIVHYATPTLQLRISIEDNNGNYDYQGETLSGQPISSLPEYSQPSDSPNTWIADFNVMQLQTDSDTRLKIYSPEKELQYNEKLISGLLAENPDIDFNSDHDFTIEITFDSYYVPVSIRINDWEIIIEEAVLPFFSPIKYMPEQRMSGRDQRMIELPDFLQSDLLHYPFGASVG